MQSSSDWGFNADETGGAALVLQEKRLALEGFNGVIGRSVVLTSDRGRALYCAAITRPPVAGSRFRSDINAPGLAFRRNVNAVGSQFSRSGNAPGSIFRSSGNVAGFPFGSSGNAQHV